ncbi:hypothetical protein HYX14_04720 [Candidatus Woesearchaeota archaeon]|nr:hypothetical protein [Candidatus Woesearchaeota archaeon]
MKLKLHENWVESASLALLAIGFIFSVFMGNSILSFISVFLAGAVAARIYYIKRYKEPILPFILMIIGFLLGYWVGNFWASRLASLFFFAAGFGLSYYLHLKKYITIFKNQNFFK